MSAERVLRPRAWYLACAGGAALLFLSGAAFTYWHSGWSPQLGVFVGLSVIGLAGLVEAATTRITLGDGTLEAGSAWRRRRYAASELRSVKWEGGSGVALELVAGGWVELPELGYNSQGLSNTLRAWLKRNRSFVDRPNP